MDEEKAKMDPKAKALAILFILLIIGVAAGLIISNVGLSLLQDDFNSRYDAINEIATRRAGDNKWIQNYLSTNQQGAWENFSEMYTIVTIVICMNLFVLLGILGFYVQGFNKTKSNFVLGLILFLGVWFLQSFLSLPIIQTTFGQTIWDLSLFNILPNMFGTIALIIFFYLSSE